MPGENIISECEIAINGARVYYQICGMREKIPLLFFHGWVCNWRNYEGAYFYWRS